jgi:hypothetical protein
MEVIDWTGFEAERGRKTEFWREKEGQSEQHVAQA